VASLRRQWINDRTSAAQVISAEACTSSQAHPLAHNDVNGKLAPGGSSSRRRTRKKRDGDASRATVGDSTDSSQENGAADSSRPKLRRKKKTRTKNKKKKNSVECVTVEDAVVSVAETAAAVVNGVANDVEEFSAEEESHQNGTDQPSSSFVDVCIALPEADDLPEVDGLSCEPDGSSSRQEAEVVDYSVCSTVGSGGRNRSRSPVPLQPSPLPASTTTSTSLYGQQSAFLSDVHGSLPLLPRALDNDRRLVPLSDRTSSACRLPKSVSLQGYQNFLSVDDAMSARHRRHRRHLTASNYRPLTGQRGRHTLSRLDVEYVNRSQVFEMISGE